MLRGKLRSAEMVFAVLFGEWKTFKLSDERRIKYQLIYLLAKLDIKSAVKILANL